MSESDATLIIETTHGPEPLRIVRDGSEDKPDEHWWPVIVSDGPAGIQWESWL